MKVAARLFWLSIIVCALVAALGVLAHGENAPAGKLVSLEVGGDLQKKAYVYGERLDLTGLVLTAAYDNGAKKDVTGLVKVTSAMNAGDTSVTLSYTEGGAAAAAEVGGISIAKKTLDIQTLGWKAGSFVFNGKEQRMELAGVIPEELTASYDGNSAVNAGTYTASAAFSLKEGLIPGNYDIIGTNPITAAWTIAKAPAPDFAPYTLTLDRTQAHSGVKVDIGAMLPADRGASSYDSELRGLIYVTDAVLSENGVLTFNTRKPKTEVSESLYVKVTSENYAAATLHIKVALTGKETVAITGVTRSNGVYNGQPQKGYVGKPSGYSGGYDITYYQGQTQLEKMPTDAGDYTVIIAVPKTDYNHEGSLRIDFTIHKATVTIRADSKEIYKDSRMPSFSYKVSGLAKNDKLAALPTVSCGGDVSVVGQYAVTASGAAVPDSGNYDENIVYIDGVLSVKSRYSPVITNKRPPVTSSSGSRYDYDHDDNDEDGDDNGGAADNTSDWNSIKALIPLKQSGSVISAGGSTTVPADVMSVLKGRDITLEIQADDRALWRINGKDITAAKAVDLSVEVGGNRIPTSKENEILDDLSTLQVSLDGSGELGMTAWLQTNIGFSGAGKIANLYYLDPLTDSFELVAAGKADAVGNVLLPFTGAGNYCVAVDDISRIPGDGDNSGTVDLLDVLAIVRDAEGIEVFGVKKRGYMDLNGDGAVNADDAVFLFRKLVF